jgi:hypothetical protein
VIETIRIEENVCALIVRKSFYGDNIEFFTKPEDSLQLGYMRREKGYKIQPHAHKKVVRSVEYTNEVLFIKSGVVKVKFYDDELKFRVSCVLDEGDTILLMACGHGFEMIEESQILEVKQGPYAGDEDKFRFSE